MRLRHLEALRGFAAFAVILNHTVNHNLVVWGVQVGHFFRTGQEAVILFFLLSGFVIFYSHDGSKHKDFKAYFLNRFLRIYVPLLPVFFAGYVLACYKSDWAFVDPQWRDLGLNLLMLQDLGRFKPNTIVEPYMLNGALWSLSYEWWFYMLFFPIYTYFSITGQRVLVFILVSIGAVSYQLEPNFLSRLLMYFAIWWGGVEIARIWKLGTVRQPSKYLFPALLLLVPILSQGTTVWLNWSEGLRLGYHPVLELRHLVFAGLAIVAGYLWLRLRWVGFFLLLGPFELLAPLTYGTYIIHGYTAVQYKYLDFVGNSFIEWLGYFMVTVLLAYLLEMKFYPLCKRMILACTSRPKETITSISETD